MSCKAVILSFKTMLLMKIFEQVFQFLRTGKPVQLNRNLKKNIPTLKRKFKEIMTIKYQDRLVNHRIAAETYRSGS